MITISMLTFNKLEYTKACLESLFMNTKYPVHEIVVSDNGSTDGTQDFLKSLGNRIVFVDNKENLGFAKAHNKIINMYSENDIVLVNNDIEVPFGWLSTIQHCIIKRELGAAGPSIQVKNGLDVGAVLDFQAKGRSIINDYTEPDWITGSCMYITRETIKKVGLLDCGFQFYYEDVDFCHRLKIAGIKFQCIREVVIKHHNSVSSTPEWKKKIMEESRLYFLSKHRDSK